MALQDWCCPHLRTTPSERDGYAICKKCGAEIVVKLTPAVLDDAVKAGLRK